MNSALIHATK